MSEILELAAEPERALGQDKPVSLGGVVYGGMRVAMSRRRLGTVAPMFAKEQTA